MATSDLGGLGAKEGPAKSYSYSVPSLMPAFIPWLLILGLLGLKINRQAQAWWIWLPLVGVAVLVSGAQQVVGDMSNGPLEMIWELVGAAPFGIATVWLLGAYLAHKYRALSFLGILASMGISSLLSFALRQDWNFENGAGDFFMIIGFTIFFGLAVLLISLALVLAGFTCRRRYGPARFVLWLSVYLLAGWTLVAFAGLALFNIWQKLSRGLIAWTPLQA